MELPTKKCKGLPGEGKLTITFAGKTMHNATHDQDCMGPIGRKYQGISIRKLIDEVLVKFKLANYKVSTFNAGFIGYIHG